jgi:hypothetical protein
MTEDSRGADVKRALAEWRLTPPHLREPQTIAALARKLGVSRSLLNYYDERTPQSPEDFIEACERNALGKYYSQALDAMGRKAAENVEAFKAYFKAVVEPRRPQRQGKDHAASLKAVFDQCQVVIHAAAVGDEPKLVEESSKKPIPVQIAAHVESATCEK